MGIVGRLDQYASMLAGEFDDYSMSENLLTYSVPSSNWGNNLSAILTYNSSSSPDGTITATQIAAPATIGSGVFRTFTLTSGITYTYSVFVKAVSGSNTIYFGSDAGTNATIQVNTSTGAVSSNTGSPTNIKSTQYSNSWYRVSFTITASATTIHSLVIYNLTANANTWLSWGAQVETGSVATDYTPTTTTAKTRVLPSTTNTNITGLSTYFSSGFSENVGAATTLAANVFPPYDLVYDDFGGTLFGAGQGRYMRQNTDKSVIVYNEIDEVSDFRDIVRTGLVLDLDAAQPLSYKGTGTTWNDLSGNGNTATMFGSVPFSTDIAPCFDFATATGVNAANSSLGFTFGSNMIPTTGDFTFSCWIKNPNASTGQVGLFSNAGGADGYRFGLNLSSVYYLIGPTYTEGNISFSSSLSSTLWYNVVAVYSRATAQVLVYLNGVYQNAASVPVSQTAMQNGAPGLVRSACCSIYTGKLAGFSAYNRALTSTEITRNYNALKHRFGL